uniref:Secreted protein n=1 Tax=Streptomyces sp. NBC_00049 TaxID=2903617 RepID=A0AAU2K0V2_9ACTN
MRPMRIHHSLPVLLLAATALAAGGPAGAAAGPDFQYVGQDDRVHGLTAPKGCVEAEGGGARAVTNRSPGTATLYREPRCAGRVVAVLRPGAVAQVRPYFSSVRFPVTG